MMIADETTFNPKEAEMAIYQLKKVMESLLQDSYTVQMGKLGSFSLTITAEACHGEKMVMTDKIKKVNLCFRAGKGHQGRAGHRQVSFRRGFDEQEEVTRKIPSTRNSESRS